MTLARETSGMTRPAALLAALLFFALPSTAFGAFEKDLLYQYDPVTFALGAGSAAEALHPLGYLSNPALLTDARSRQAAFSLSRFKGDLAPDYSSWILGYSSAGKNALTVSRSNEKSMGLTPSYGKTQYTYTFTSGKKSDAPFGFNLHFLTVNAGSGDANGFSLDVGYRDDFNEKIRYGIAVKNIASSISDLPSKSGALQKIPSFLSIGASYRRKENTRIVGGYQRTFGGVDQISAIDQDVSRFTLGVFYDMKSDMTAQFMADQTEIGNAYSEGTLGVGFGMKMNAARIDYAGMVGNSVYNSPSFFSAAYDMNWSKPGEGPETREKGAIKARPLKKIADEDLDMLNVEVEKETVAKKTIEEKETEEGAFALTVAPKAIMAPTPNSRSFLDLSRHWAGPAVDRLLANGLFKDMKGDVFKPDEQADRVDFIQTLFSVQLLNFFQGPIEFKFDLPAGGDYEMRIFLTSADGGEDVELRKTLETDLTGGSGQLDRRAIEQYGIVPGKYKLTVEVAGDGGNKRSASDWIYIYDAFSGRFSEYKRLNAEEREKRAKLLIDDLQGLGAPLDYLVDVASNEPVSRIEAGRLILKSLGVVPSVADVEGSQSTSPDMKQRPLEDLQTAYIVTRGFKSLGGKPLFTTYPDDTYRPDRPLTRGEMAALAARLLELDRDDLKPPFRPPVRQVVPKTAPIPAVGAATLSSIPQAAPTKSAGPVYLLSAASAMNRGLIEEKSTGLMELGYSPEILEESIGRDAFYYAVVGKYENKAAAERGMKKLAELGYVPTIRRMETSAVGQTTPVPAPKPSSPIAPTASKQAREGILELSPMPKKKESKGKGASPFTLRGE